MDSEGIWFDDINCLVIWLWVLFQVNPHRVQAPQAGNKKEKEKIEIYNRHSQNFTLLFSKWIFSLKNLNAPKIRSKLKNKDLLVKIGISEHPNIWASRQNLRIW